MWLHYPNIISSSLPNAILLPWYLSKKWCKDLFHGLLLQHIFLCSQSPWFPRGTSTTLTSVERATQQSTNNTSWWLESVDDNFVLPPVMEGPTRKSALLEPILYNKEDLATDVKALATFIMVTIRSWNSLLLEEEISLSFRRVNFSLFRDHLWRISCEHALQRRGILESQYSTITLSRLKTSAWWARNACQNSNLGRR